VAVIGIIVVIAIGVGAMSLLGGGSGKVLFSKTAYNEGSNTCQFDSPITTASTTDSIFVIADFKDTLKTGDTYTITEVKDGTSLGSPTPITASKEFNCYIEQGDIGPLTDPGVYKFTFTKDGKTEAEGTLTIVK
jgi:hypothetical protein